MSQANVSHLPTWNDAGVARPRPRPNFHQPSQASEQPKKKFVAKGHDAQLQDAQYGKNTVIITTMSGEFVIGNVVRRDKFTVTIRITKGTDVGSELIVFKHAIESILIEKSVDGE